MPGIWKMRYFWRWCACSMPRSGWSRTTIFAVVSLIISSHEIHICHARGCGRKTINSRNFIFHTKQETQRKQKCRSIGITTLTWSRFLISKLINLFQLLLFQFRIKIASLLTTSQSWHLFWARNWIALILWATQVFCRYVHHSRSFAC